MDYKIYEVVVSPEVVEKIKEIENYIAVRFSKDSAKKRTSDILKAFENLNTFPEIGFNADEKLGVKIDSRHSMRGVIILKKYIVFYWIDQEKYIVNIAQMFSTREDYLKLLVSSKGL